MQSASNVILLVAVWGWVIPTAAAPPVSFPPGTDLDANSTLETEFSRLSQEFVAPTIGGRIRFDWQVFSSEFFGGAAEDLFYVRLIDTATGTVLDEFNRALDPTTSGYTGSFTPIGAPPMGTTGPSEAPAGGAGLMFNAFHLDGGTGWVTNHLSFPPAANDHTVKLEFLVADAFDRNADTSLAIDKIAARDVTGALIASLTNPSFEDLLTSWTIEGNTGVYATLADLFNGTPEPGSGPTDGKLYALLSTAGTVPEPASFSLVAFASLALISPGRRSRHLKYNTCDVD